MACGNCLRRIEEKLDAVLSNLAQVHSQLEKLMALADDIKAAIASLDTETTAVAANIATLAGRIKNTMTDAEVADIQASFSTLGTRLTSLAADPTVPVPPAPGPLVQLRKKLK